MWVMLDGPDGLLLNEVRYCKPSSYEKADVCVGLAYKQWLKDKALICLTWQQIGIGTPGLVPSRNQPLSSPFIPVWEMAAMPQGSHSLQTEGKKVTRGLTSVYISLATAARTWSLLAARESGKVVCIIPNSVLQKGKGKVTGHKLPYLPRMNRNKF